MDCFLIYLIGINVVTFLSFTIDYLIIAATATIGTPV